MNGSSHCQPEAACYELSHPRLRYDVAVADGGYRDDAPGMSCCMKLRKLSM